MGLRPLLLPDEGRYATVARDMLQQGDGLVPLLNGLPFFHKPPLMYWLDMAAMSVVGVNAFAARFAAFVGAFAMGAALFLAARRWHGGRAAAAALAPLAAGARAAASGRHRGVRARRAAVVRADAAALPRLLRLLHRRAALSPLRDEELQQHAGAVVLSGGAFCPHPPVEPLVAVGSV